MAFCDFLLNIMAFSLELLKFIFYYALKINELVEVRVISRIVHADQ